jgi:hypothetical protein
MQEPAPSDSDAADDRAVIRNQDLAHQRDAHVSKTNGMKVPAPTVDSGERRYAERLEKAREKVESFKRSSDRANRRSN